VYEGFMSSVCTLRGGQFAWYNKARSSAHGDYGVTVNTGACGALDQGSIPCSRPMLKNFFKEFETFAIKGNALDLAIGVVIGAAFGQVTNSLSTNVLSPFVGLFLGGYDFSKLSLTLLGDAQVQYGLFLQAVLNFIIIAFALFLIVKLINRLTHRRKEEEAKPKPVESEELRVLKEIRDALKTTHS
jgi:large conductance mechanosensitive channel